MPRPWLDLLEEAARAHGTRDALVDPRERLSFAAVAAHARAVAYGIARAVPVGGSVAALLPYSPLGVATALGCLASGRITMALNAAEAAERLAQTIAHARPDLILQPDALGGTDRPGPARMTFRESASRQPPAAWAPPDIGTDAPAMVHFTSGSTGTPKGIVLSHHAVATRAAAAASSLRFAPGERSLATSGPHVASGFSFLLAAISTGTTHCCASLATHGAGGLLRMMQREPPDVTITNAALSRMLFGLSGSAAAFARVRLHRMGAMGLPRQDWEYAVAALPRGCVLSHTYASTEAQVVAEWELPDEPPPGPTLASGWLTGGWHYALVGPDGRPVGDGEAGELILRDRRIALGEWQAGAVVPGRMAPDPEDPSRRIFHTGDMMRQGSDGLLRFAGRVDRQINVNGVRIEPGEIEAVLRQEPGVRDAAVVPGDDGRPVAFVAAAALQEGALGATLAARVRSALPAALRPASITVLPELPLMASGKVDLQALRRAARQG